MRRDSYQHYLAVLAQKRAPALQRATALIEAQRYDEAEKAVTEADDSIYGAVALAKLYRQCLAEAVAGDCQQTELPRRLALFQRALIWAQSAFPEPHTQTEADDYQRHRTATRAELVALLGFDPEHY